METTLGIRILTGRAAQTVSADSQAIRCAVGTETLVAELFICAVGRKPVTDGLKLDNAGLKTGEDGFIEADDYCRTTAANIFAIGDVTGKTQLAHFATAQGITAAENAHLRPQHKHETIVPNVIFTSPEIGTVGLTEEAAMKQNRAVKVGKFRLSGLGKAIATAQTTGFAKWIADAGTNQLLGAAVVGAHATDLIAEAALAIHSELTVAELGRTIHAHPTFGELWMEAADAMHGKSIHAPPKRVPPP
jgi:dihydrolipoamide dehydrogenase